VYCSVVLEVLYIVNEQVERRTYGAMSLNSVSGGGVGGSGGSSGGGSGGGNTSNTSTTANPNTTTTSTTNTTGATNASYLHTVHTSTIAIWENLVRQTRVALLLQSRSGTSGGLARYVVILFTCVLYCGTMEDKSNPHCILGMFHLSAYPRFRQLVLVNFIFLSIVLTLFFFIFIIPQHAHRYLSPLFHYLLHHHSLHFTLPVLWRHLHAPDAGRRHFSLRYQGRAGAGARGQVQRGVYA